MVGGRNPLDSARIAAVDSIAPAAPSVCPCMAFVDEIASRFACVSESEMQGAGLGDIVHRGAGAMSIDVADLLRRDTCILQRHPHRFRRAFGGGLRDVMRVARHPEPDDLGQSVSRLAPARGRAIQCTIMAPPSPSIMPLRSRENGRQTVGETTRIASQALRIP